MIVISGNGPAQLSIASLMARMASGGRVSAWWEVGVSTETITGQGFSQLDDCGPGGYHVVQATDANRPAKDATGGPLGDSCISYAGTDDRLTNTGISLASGKALYIIAVAKGVEVGGARVQATVRQTAESSGDAVFACIDAATANYLDVAKCATGAEETITVTSPAHSTNWYKRTTRYETALVPAAEIGDVAISPAHTTISGLAAAVEVVVLGHHTAAAGKLKLLGIFESVTAAEEAMIHAYVLRRTGL